MRYLSLLLFVPSAAFSACIAGVNYGQYPITAGNPVCAPYSGSSLGGCFAYCGGSSAGAVCLELTSANPPTKGPYFTNGHECQYKNGGDSNSGGNVGGNPDGIDGTNTGPTGTVDVGSIMVGDKYIADFGKGFNAVANNVNKSSEKIKNAVTDLSNQIRRDRDWDNAKYYDPMLSLLERIAQNTSGGSSGGESGPSHEVVGYLKSINDKTVLDPSFWLNEIYKDREKAQYYYSNMRDLVAHIDGILEWGPNNGGGNNNGGNNNGNGNGNGNGGIPDAALNSIYNIEESTGKLNELFGGRYSPYMKGMMDTNQLLNDISGKLDNLGQGGDGEGGQGGDKPCKGPLCSFDKPLGSTESGLSSVFSEQSITDIKKRVEEKDTEIKTAMSDIKSVFAPEQLSINGSYDNNYQDIHGARVDLSGKSNMELFFNSGPKAVIWFLAVLIAFTILMGGRKNA